MGNTLKNGSSFLF